MICFLSTYIKQRGNIVNNIHVLCNRQYAPCIFDNKTKELHYAIEQWGLFSVPHLLWHGHPFIMVISEDLWHSTYCRAFGSGAVTACFYDWGLSRLKFEHPTFSLRGKLSNPLRHRRGTKNMRIRYLTNEWYTLVLAKPMLSVFVSRFLHVLCTLFT